MIRFDPDESSEMSEEKRFYYLRLMAKPGGKPIKTKFVTWSRDEDKASASNISNQQLESQAMRVVRTIGQAFEVCHKVAQEQMQEKHEDDAAKSKISAQSEDEAGPALDVIEEGGIKEEMSRSSSPMEGPPVGGPLYGKRLSLFQPRKASTASSSGGTAIDTTAIPEQALEIPTSTSNILQPKAPELVPQLQPQTALPYQQKQPAQSLLNIQPTQFNTLPSQMPSTQTLPSMTDPSSHNPRLMTMQYPSATLPHSRTWAAQVPSYPQSMQSLEQNVPMYYPQMSGILPSSSSLPFGLSSPVMVSPYATLQLNMPAQHHQHLEHVDSNSQITLEQLNQQLMRSQLDQAQQSVQVAGCQVQLLRDQLTSETTARLEAQSRTHQLLSANRELLEQVQNLVTRLQMLESKITNEIHVGTSQPSSSQHQQQSTSSPASARIIPLSIDNSDPRIPSGSVVRPNYPYQVQPLADLRAGSLPPAKEVKERKKGDDGARTEPESNADDTTDYSSSDQYEKTSNVVRPSHFNILMSNPLVDINVPSGAAMTTTKEQEIEEQQSCSNMPRRERRGTTGILRGEKDFSRMSFNAKYTKALKEKEREQPMLYDDTLEEEMDLSLKEISPPRKEKTITIDSLFKSQDDPPTISDKEQQQQAPPRKETVSAFSVASSSIVTAMYPPVKTSQRNKPKVDVFRKKTLKTLSVDMPDEPTASDANRNQNMPAAATTAATSLIPSSVRKRDDVEIKEIEDYINRNVDRSKLPETSLLSRLTRQAQGDATISNLPNGYPQ